MLAKTASLAALAATAQSFMIPSTMSLRGDEQQMDIASSLPEVSSRLIKLPCPECTLPGADADIDGVALMLDFATTPDGTGLTLNDAHMYPPAPARLFASEIPASIPAGLVRSYAAETSPQPLRYALAIDTIEAADGSDAQLIDMRLLIRAVGETPVTVDRVALRVLRDEDNKLRIADVALASEEGAHAEEADEEEQTFSILPIPHETMRLEENCGAHPALCRIKAAVEDRLAMLRETIASHGTQAAKKPCHGGLRLKGGPNKIWGIMNSPHAGHGHGHGFGGPRVGHMPHGRYPRPAMHRFGRALRQVFFGFVVPVAIGLAAGMCASVLGMFVGTLIAWVWIKVVRGGRRGNATGAVVLEDSEESEEKRGLMEDAEEDELPPPVYVERA